MSHTKRYPDKSKLRKQSKCIAAAMKALTTIGIEIMSIDCTYALPRIEVFHCPGVERLKPEDFGQGHNLAGAYVRKMAHVQGCQVEWNQGTES